MRDYKVILYTYIDIINDIVYYVDMVHYYGAPCPLYRSSTVPI